MRHFRAKCIGLPHPREALQLIDRHASAVSRGRVGDDSVEEAAVRIQQLRYGARIGPVSRQPLSISQMIILLSDLAEQGGSSPC